MKDPQLCLSQAANHHCQYHLDQNLPVEMAVFDSRLDGLLTELQVVMATLRETRPSTLYFLHLKKSMMLGPKGRRVGE